MAVNQALDVVTATQRQVMGHVHKYYARELNLFNASHRINHLSFAPAEDMYSDFLRGLRAMVGLKTFRMSGSGSMDGESHSFKRHGRSVYLIKVVPIELHYSSGNVRTMYDYRYTVYHTDTEAEKSRLLPGVMFRFEISPYKVVKHQIAPPFSHTFASVLGIIAGMLMLTRVITTYCSSIASFIECTRSGKAASTGASTSIKPENHAEPPAPTAVPSSKQPPSYLPFLSANTTTSRHLD